MTKRTTLIFTSVLLASISMFGAKDILAMLELQPNGNFYAYTDKFLKGAYIFSWSGNSRDWPDQIDNKSSSWFNNGYNTEPDEVVLYDLPNYVRPIACIPRGVAVAFDSVIDNRPSSHRWVTSCPAINH